METLEVHSFDETADSYDQSTSRVTHGCKASTAAALTQGDAFIAITQ